MEVLTSVRTLYPWLRHVFADGGYAGNKLRDALATLGHWTIEIIKRSDAVKGLMVLKRRWVVERTFAWLGRCRGLAKDFEASIESAVAWVFIAHIRMLTRASQDPERPHLFLSQALRSALAQARIGIVKILQTRMNGIVKIFTLTFTELHRP